MSLINIPFTFTVGAVIVASQHNSCFSIIYSDYNGNITDANIASNAAIADSKLVQITTAGKVSGAALTTLTSIPAGAGLIPTANLGAGATSSKVLSGAQTYIDPSTVITGLLGSWVTKSIDTIYQATTDGFAVGYASGAPSGGIDLKSDSSATPTTIRSSAATTVGTSFTVFTPVKKNDYYKFTTTGTINGVNLFFIPLGS